MRLLHGSTPQGHGAPLGVALERAAPCARCEQLEQRCAALERRLEQRPPPPPRERSPKRARTGDGPAAEFVRSVGEKLGARASTHLSQVLPPAVLASVVQGCSDAIVMLGARMTVADRRKHVLDLRLTLSEVPGVLSVFFEWSDFRLVLFVNHQALTLDDLWDKIQSEDFVQVVPSTQLFIIVDKNSPQITHRRLAPLTPATHRQSPFRSAWTNERLARRLSNAWMPQRRASLRRSCGP